MSWANYAMNPSDPLYVKAVERYVFDKGGFDFYANRVDPDSTYVDFAGFVVLKRRKTREVLARYLRSELIPVDNAELDGVSTARKTIFEEVIESTRSSLFTINCKDNRYTISAYEDYLCARDGRTGQAINIQWSDVIDFKPVWINKNCFTINIRNIGAYPFWVSTAAIPLEGVSTCEEACNSLEGIRKRILAENAIRRQEKLASGTQAFVMTIVTSHGLQLPEGVMVEAAFSAESLSIRLCDANLEAIINSEEIIQIEVTGPGTVTTNAGLVGGGFGFEGAAWGIAAASIINAITTSSTTNTLVNVATRKSSITLHTSQFDTEELRLRLSSHIASAVSRAKMPITAAPAVDLTAKIRELADMNSQGLLTDEEFSTAKAKLLGL